MNELFNFEGNNVEVIVGKNGEPLFEIYSTGMALGHVKIAKGKAYPRKDRIDKNIKNAEISTYMIDDKKFIDIEGLKNFISLCHTENKIKFLNCLKEKGYINYTDVSLYTKKEIFFLNQLEDVLKPFDIQGIRQYHVLSYRIDYYIPDLKIAIEYDENNHKNYSYEAHEGRQQEIEKELGCRFIRVSDNSTNSYNIGLVIKEMFNL